MQVQFVKNSDQRSQVYFEANLVDFSAEGVQIKLNFSDPLLVSVGEAPDFVKIKLQKEFFMNPIADDWSSRMRHLARLPNYETDEYVIITEELPLLMANDEEFEKLTLKIFGSISSSQVRLAHRRACWSSNSSSHSSSRF